VEKEEGDAIQYVMPFAKQLSVENARSVKTNQSILIDAGYPQTLRVRSISTGRSVNPITNIEDTSYYFVDMKAREFLEQLNPEELAAHGITSQEVYDSFIARFLANEERIKTFWEKVYEVKDTILDLTETEILEGFGDDFNGIRATLVSDTIYLLPDYEDKLSWNKPSGGTLWCGPVALYFGVLGLGYTKSGYINCPTYNTDPKINTMYKEFENRIGTGATTFIEMDAALRYFTYYRLHNAALSNAHIWSYSHSSITGPKLPVVSLRSGRPTIFDAWHYRLIIGTRVKRYKEKKTFLWETWYEYYNNNYYKIWDVGGTDKDTSSWSTTVWEIDGKADQLFTTKFERY
jgi:hypothetical protein